nr:platelet-activating factor acetylhydrolase 2, cytoplasmic-like isoform X2 [Physcomitrium patens]|eukprot:XP_024390730.1 platelet-activating factor acetylhydrolase 2, cytoplasmic-like isoform X2 [Physcomitrella patens]
MCRQCDSSIPQVRIPSGISPTRRRGAGCRISTTHGATSPKLSYRHPAYVASPFGSSRLHCSVAKPVLIPEGEDKNGRLPVVIFCHGMWACRTTYTLACCDIASHGYIVVAVEHLDGSAVAAKYRDEKGKSKWITHAFAERPFDDTPIADRSKQLRQRTDEVRKVVDVLEMLTSGLLTQKANAVKGKTALDLRKIRGRMDMSHLAIRGHSFGGSTAIVACGLDKRLKCCIAEDAWWQPIEQLDFDRVAGKVPLLLVNTELFEWNDLRRLRTLFLKARADARRDEQPLVTELFTIKGARHMDQSDFPVMWPRIFKAAKLSGTVDASLVKDINSRLSLEFLHRNLLPPGTGAPYAVEILETDTAYLLDSTLPQPAERLSPAESSEQPEVRTESL